MTWEPEDITGIEEVWVADDVALTDGDPVVTATGRVSGSVLTAENVVYRTASINGQPALEFVAADSAQLVGAPLITGSPGSYFFIATGGGGIVHSSVLLLMTNSGDGSIAFACQAASSGTLVAASDGAHTNILSGAGGDPPITADPTLYEFGTTGTRYTSKINGKPHPLATINGSDDGTWSGDFPLTDLRIGADANMKFAVIGALTGVMTDSDRHALYRYAQDRYGADIFVQSPQVHVLVPRAFAPVTFDVPQVDVLAASVRTFASPQVDVGAMRGVVTFASPRVDVAYPEIVPVEVAVHVGAAVRQPRLAFGNVARRAIQGGLRLVDTGAVFTDRVTIELADPDGPGLIEGSVPESFGRDFLDELNGPGSIEFKLRNEVLDQSAPDPYAVPMIANPSRLFAHRKKIARFSIDGEPVFQGFIEHETEHKVAKGGADRFTLLTGRGLDALWGHCTVMPTNVAMRGGLLTGNVPIQYQRRFCYIDPRYEPNGWEPCVSVARQDFIKPPTQRWVGNPPGWTDPIAFWVAPAGTHVDPDTGQVGIWYLRVEQDIAFETPDQTDDCTLYYAADDAAVIFLDGVKLATSVGWEQLQKVAIPGMTSGTHVLAAQVTNAATVTGLIYTLIRDSTNEILFRSNEQTIAGDFTLVLPFPDHEPGMTVGQVLEILLGEAQFLRGMAPAMQLGFDKYVDSAGNPWPVVSDITLNVGDTYDKVMAYLGESYCDYRWRPSGWTLDAYVPGTMRKAVAVGYQSGVDEDTDNLTTLDRETLNEVANVLTVQWNHGVFIIEADGVSPSDRIEGFVKYDVDTLDEALVLGRATLALTSTAPSSLTASVVTRSNDDTFYVNGTLVGDDVPLDGDTERLVALRVAQQDGGSKLLTFTPEFKSKWQEREDRLQTYINRIIPGGVGGVSQLPSDATDEVPGDEIVKTRTYAFTFGDGSPDTRGPLPADVSGHVRQVMIRRDGNLGTTTATVKINGKALNEELDGQPDPFDPEHDRATIPTIQIAEGQTLAKLTIYPPVPIHPFTDAYSVELVLGNNTRTIVTVILEMKPIL